LLRSIFVAIACGCVVAVAAALGAEARTHGAGSSAVPRIVAGALPAIVSVTTRQIERDQFNQPLPTRGLGSGFIIDRRGHVLTNNHVVEGAEEIKITLSDGRSFGGALVGSDRFADLALLQIEGSGFTAVKLGDASRLAVGETVIAIGSPLWIEGGPTVTVGVVSARALDGAARAAHPSQSHPDRRAINPGNSGGPLLNLQGQVVGINTAVIASAHGIGFAVSVNDARPVVRELLARGRVSRVTLGVTGVSVTPQVAYANALPVDSGVLVVRLEPGGAAEFAGLEPGDIITRTGGVPVKDLHHFHQALSNGKPGEAVDLEVLREGRVVTLRPTLKEER
jgi:serine protease Do